MKLYKLSLFIFLPVLILISGCEDNPVSSGAMDHAQAFGFIVEDEEGTEIVRFIAREYTFNPESPYYDFVNEDGRLVLTEELLDDEMMTEELTVRWLDADEEVFDLPDQYDEAGNRVEEAEWNLEWQYFEPTESNQYDDELSHEESPVRLILDNEEASWKFNFYASESGEVDIRLIIFHIDHEDFLPRQGLPIAFE